MQRSIKKKVCLITVSIGLFLTMSCAKDTNSKNTTNSTAAPLKTLNDTDTQKTFGKKAEKMLHLHHQMDWKNGMVKIFWTPVQNASRYHVVCIRKSDFQKILEKDISAQEETACVHEIEYGEKYNYEVSAYQKVNGSEVRLTYKDDYNLYKNYNLRILPSPINWESGLEIKTEKATTLVFYPRLTNYISPTGIEIYHGKDKEHMKLVHTVKYEKLSDFYPKEYNSAKKYVDKNRSRIDYYQLRSYIDMDGKRRYGEKSEIELFRENGYKGEVKACIKMKSKKQKIKNMEVVIKNAGKEPIKAGMPYIKNYYKPVYYDETGKVSDYEKGKIGYYEEIGEDDKKYVFGLNYGRDDTFELISSNDLGIDKIEYKSNVSDGYKMLSGDATVIIKPGKKLFLRFSRKDGRKFRNCFVDGARRDSVLYTYADWPDCMSIYLFEYMGKKTFIQIYARKEDGKIVFYPHTFSDITGDYYHRPDD